MASVVRFDSVAIRYGEGPEILSDLSFELPEGSFHFLSGASGAGKSSLLKLMYLALRPAAGRYVLFGEDVARLPRTRLPALRRRIGVVFQDFRLLPHLSVAENVALPLRLAGAPEHQVRQHVGELLDWVGLGDRLDRAPAVLSGGEQQRVAIARAVVSNPSLLLADEPTGNVDDEIGLRLMRLFEHLHRGGTTVLVATHNARLADRFTHPRLHIAEGALRHSLAPAPVAA